MSQRTAKQIYTKLKEAQNILLVPHMNPDGDAIGSVFALARYLDDLGKKVEVYCATSIPETLDFLPLNKYINQEAIKQQNFEVLVTLDSGDLERTGIRKEELKNKPFIINIDHHDTNTNFGNLNLVFPKAASTTEIIFQFFKYNKIKLTPLLATSLFTGLATDTGYFTNAATTPFSLETASHLIKEGADFSLVKNSVLKNKSIEALKLWGNILGRLKKEPKLDIVYTYLTLEDMKKYNLTEELDGITNLLNQLNEGKIALLAREKENQEFKVSLRTTRDDVDVAKIAQKFNGGGHKKAAGFTISGNLDSIFSKIWEKLEK